MGLPIMMMAARSRLEWLVKIDRGRRRRKNFRYLLQSHLGRTVKELTVGQGLV